MAVAQLIYVRGSGDVRSDMLGALLGQGYKPAVFTAIDEVIKACAQGRPELVIIDASAGEAEASQRFVELSGATALKEVPIIFISRQAVRRSAVLKKQFTTFIAIDVPFKMAVLLAQLAKLVPPPKEVEKPSVKQSEQESTATVVTTTEREQSQVKVSATAHESLSPTTQEQQAAPPVKQPPATLPKPVPVRERGKMPSIYSSTNIVATYGGEILSGGNRLESFDDTLLIPEHPARERIVEVLDRITKLDEWTGLHSRRVSFIASAIANSLGFGHARDVNVRVAGMLLNWALVEEYAKLASHDLFLNRDADVLSRITASFEETARRLKEQLKDEIAGRTLRAMVGMLRSEPTTEDPSIILDAHCTLATELADRACWGDGSWDPYGAHRAVRMLWRGEVLNFDRSVLGAINRVLVEATASHASWFASRRGGDFEEDMDRRLIDDAMQEAEQLFSGQDCVTLQIADLKPGMRLAMPLVSWDGRLILRANTFLDHDTIRRLWQLATIRALRPPIQVLAKFG